MSTEEFSPAAALGAPAPGTLLDRAALRLLLGHLPALRRGRLELRFAGSCWAFGESEEEAALRAVVRVHDPRFFRAVALGGSIGAGEAYMAGMWDADDLPALVRILAANPEGSAGLESAGGRLTALAQRLRHVLRCNTRSGSRRNIMAHYDLGNDFFALFLDPTMSYSGAVYPRPEATLEEASIHKMDLACRKLGIRPGDEVLEIGGGWGGFAVHAAAHHGARVVTSTVSAAQHRFARERIRAAGLQDRVQVLLADYRDLPARLGRRFDKVVSIEMIEAVGHRYLPAFFRACDALLKPGGSLLLQAILIGDRDYPRYRRSVDFIQRHIFPGGCLPSLGALVGAAAAASRLRAYHLEELTGHYVRTLQDWRRTFLARRGEARALGLPESFLRMWDYYLAYCEGGFQERHIGLVQILWGGPGSARLVPAGVAP